MAGKSSIHFGDFPDFPTFVPCVFPWDTWVSHGFVQGFSSLPCSFTPWSNLHETTVLRVTYCNTAMNNSPFIDNLWQSTYLKKWRCSLISHSYVDIHLGYYVYIYISYFIKYIIWSLTIDYPGQYTSPFHDWCKLDTYVIICIWIVWKFGIPKSKLQFCGIPVCRIHHFETQNPHNSLWRWYIPPKKIPCWFYRHKLVG